MDLTLPDCSKWSPARVSFFFNSSSKLNSHSGESIPGAAGSGGAAREGFLRRGDRRRRHPCSPEGGRGAQDGHQAGACPQDLQQGARSTDQEEVGVVDMGGVGAKSYQSHKHRGIPRNKFLMN